MKKLKVFLVSLLAMITALFCFAGCFGGVEGVYKVTDYRVGNMSFDVAESSTSYIEIKEDNVVVMDISVGNALTIEETGALVEKEEKGEYEIQVKEENVTTSYKATLEDNVLIVEFPGLLGTVTVIAEKQA